MAYVYVLTNQERTFFYTGSTNNIKRRVQEHNRGECFSTAPYKPLTLELLVIVRSLQHARNLEKYFKTGSGKAILKKRFLEL